MSITSKEIRRMVKFAHDNGVAPRNRTGVSLSEVELDRLADALEVLEFIEAGGCVMWLSGGDYGADNCDPENMVFRDTPLAAVRAAKGAK